MTLEAEAVGDSSLSHAMTTGLARSLTHAHVLCIVIAACLIVLALSAVLAPGMAWAQNGDNGDDEIGWVTIDNDDDWRDLVRDIKERDVEEVAVHEIAECFDPLVEFDEEAAFAFDEDDREDALDDLASALRRCDVTDALCMCMPELVGLVRVRFNDGSMLWVEVPAEDDHWYMVYFIDGETGDARVVHLLPGSANKIRNLVEKWIEELADDDDDGGGGDDFDPPDEPRGGDDDGND